MPHHVCNVLVKVEAADRAREAEELRQQLSGGAQHADALAAAQSQVHDLEQQLSQVQAALQQEASRAQEALQVCSASWRLLRNIHASDQRGNLSPRGGPPGGYLGFPRR